MPYQTVVGDTVAFTKSFLERHQYPSDMPGACGKVIALHRIDKDIVFADIEWDQPGLPKRVNVKNLQCAGTSDSSR